MGSAAGQRSPASRKGVDVPALARMTRPGGQDETGAGKPAGRLTQADLVRWSLLRLPDTGKR